MSKCISCEFAVTHGQQIGKGLCWKEKAESRKPKDVQADRKCDKYALGAMDNVRQRVGFKP